MSQPLGNRRFALMLAATMLATGIGSYFLAVWYRGQPDQNAAATFRSRPEVPKPARPVRKDVQPTDQRTSASGMDTQPELAPLPANDSSIGEPGVYRIVIRAQGPDGAPVAGVQLQVRHVTPLGKPTQPVSSSQGNTNNHGELPVSVTPGDTILIDVLSDQWHCPRLERLPAEDSLQVLYLEPARALHVTALYDDGAPFTGYGEVCGHAGDSYYASFWFSSEGTVSVTGVRASKPLSIRLHAHVRAGYDTHVEEVSAETLLAEARLTLVVPPAARPRAHLRLLFTTPLPQGCTLVMERRQPQGGDSALSAALPQGALQWESAAMRPGTACRPVIVGTRAWQSGWIILTDSAVHDVHVDLQESGTVGAVLVDESGVPVRNAVLRISDGEYSDLEGPTPPGKFSSARSDGDGFVRLSGLPAGTNSVQAEAPGRQPVEVIAEVNAGSETNLGFIRLNRAAGKLVVRLLNADAGKVYRVQLIQPGVRPLDTPRTIRNGVHTYSNVPVRTYLVGVYVAPGGFVRQRQVDLSIDVPEQVIEIDVQGLEAD